MAAAKRLMRKQSRSAKREAEIEASRSSIYRQPRRALSSPLLVDESEQRPQLDLSQEQSVFFSLPLELRRTIYEMVLWPSLHDGAFLLRRAHDGTGTLKLKRYHDELGTPWAEDHILDLPMTCRKMYVTNRLLLISYTQFIVYNETIDLLYSLPTFYFDQPGVDALTHFTSITIPARKAAVRHLHLSFILHSLPFGCDLIPEDPEPIPAMLKKALQQTLQYPSLCRLDVVISSSPIFVYWVVEEQKPMILKLLTAVGADKSYYERIGEVCFEIQWDETPVPVMPFEVKVNVFRP